MCTGPARVFPKLTNTDRSVALVTLPARINPFSTVSQVRPSSSSFSVRHERLRRELPSSTERTRAWRAMPTGKFFSSSFILTKSLVASLATILPLTFGDRLTQRQPSRTALTKLIREDPTSSLPSVSDSGSSSASRSEGFADNSRTEWLDRWLMGRNRWFRAS